MFKKTNQLMDNFKIGLMKLLQFQCQWDHICCKEKKHAEASQYTIPDGSINQILLVSEAKLGNSLAPNLFVKYLRRMPIHYTIVNKCCQIDFLRVA